MGCKYSAAEMIERFEEDIDLTFGTVDVAGYQLNTSVVLEAVPWIRERLFEQWAAKNLEITWTNEP